MEAPCLVDILTAWSEFGELAVFSKAKLQLYLANVLIFVFISETKLVYCFILESTFILKTAMALWPFNLF